VYSVDRAYIDKKDKEAKFIKHYWGTNNLKKYYEEIDTEANEIDILNSKKRCSTWSICM
jgi:hypothetical protein